MCWSQANHLCMRHTIFMKSTWVACTHPSFRFRHIAHKELSSSPNFEYGALKNLNRMTKLISALRSSLARVIWRQMFNATEFNGIYKYQIHSVVIYIHNYTQRENVGGKKCVGWNTGGYDSGCAFQNQYTYVLWPGIVSLYAMCLPSSLMCLTHSKYCWNRLSC